MLTCLWFVESCWLDTNAVSDVVRNTDFLSNSGPLVVEPKLKLWLLASFNERGVRFSKLHEPIRCSFLPASDSVSSSSRRRLVFISSVVPIFGIWNCAQFCPDFKFDTELKRFSDTAALSFERRLIPCEHDVDRSILACGENSTRRERSARMASSGEICGFGFSFGGLWNSARLEDSRVGIVALFAVSAL